MTSARMALSGHAEPCPPGRPRPRGVDADQLLPERVLIGDVEARDQLRRTSMRR